MNKIAIWLDPNFIPEGVPQYVDKWHFCTTFEEFKNFTENYLESTGQFPVLFALTHDLTNEHLIAESNRCIGCPIMYSKYKNPTGLHVVQWLIELSKKHNIPIGKVAVHGDNEMGKANMMYELQKFKNDTNDPIPAFTMNWQLKKR